MMQKKGEYVRFKSFEEKIKSSFMIYADFECILVPEDNGKPIFIESCANNYQKRVVYNYG